MALAGLLGDVFAASFCSHLLLLLLLVLLRLGLHASLTKSLLNEHVLGLLCQVLADDLARIHSDGSSRRNVLFLRLLFTNKSRLRHLVLTLINDLALTLVRVHIGLARLWLRPISRRHGFLFFDLARYRGRLVAPQGGTVSLRLCNVTPVAH